MFLGEKKMRFRFVIALSIIYNNALSFDYAQGDINSALPFDYAQHDKAQDDS